MLEDLVAQFPDKIVQGRDVDQVSLPYSSWQELVTWALNPLPKIGMGATSSSRKPLMLLGIRSRLRDLSIDRLDLFRLRNDHFLPHMSHKGVRENEDRGPIRLGIIEGNDGMIEHLLRRRGTEGDDLIISVRTNVSPEPCRPGLRSLASPSWELLSEH